MVDNNVAGWRMIEKHFAAGTTRWHDGNFLIILV